jgi:hypothetical protein
VHFAGPPAYTLQGGTGLVAIDASRYGNQSGDRLAVSGDDDFIPSLDLIEESPEGVFRCKGSDFPHENKLA